MAEDRIEPPGDKGHPHRKHTVWLKVDAEDEKGLVNGLLNIARRIERKELSQSSVCGGGSSGHIYVHSVDEDMTHDRWAAELDEWLAEHERATKSDS